MKFADRLRILLAEKRIRQKDLAEAIGVSPSSITNYVNNKKIPPVDVAQAIANYLGVSLDYLMGSTDNRFGIDEDVNEIKEIIKAITGREEVKILFKKTKELSPESIERIIRIIDAIEGGNKVD